MHSQILRLSLNLDSINEQCCRHSRWHNIDFDESVFDILHSCRLAIYKEIYQVPPFKLPEFGLRALGAIR